MIGVLLSTDSYLLYVEIQMNMNERKKGAWSSLEDSQLRRAVLLSKKPVYKYLKDEVIENMTESRSIDWFQVSRQMKGTRNASQCRGNDGLIILVQVFEKVTGHLLKIRRS